MKRINLYTLLFFLCFVHTLKAQHHKKLIQNTTTASVHINKSDPASVFYHFKEGAIKNIAAAQDYLLDENMVNGKEKITFSKNTKITDRIGQKHTRFQLNYEGVPILGSVVIIHEKESGVHAMNGKFFGNEGLPSPNNIPINESQLVETALNYLPQTNNWKKHPPFEDPQTNEQGLVYVPVSMDFNKSDFRLSKKISFIGQKDFDIQAVYVDVISGKAIARLSEICTHTNDLGIGETTYYGEQEIETTADGNHYVLKDLTRGQGITTLDALHTFSFLGTPDFYEFTDADNNWENNERHDAAAIDVHWGLARTYDYYLDKYNRKSMDDQELPITAYVHVGINYLNAFWSPNALTLSFGDGSTNGRPVTTLDICSHEFTHGVTQFSAGLIYSQESGGLNESFSDIFGVGVDFYVNGNGANFQIGEQLYPPGSEEQFFRNMEDPKSAGNPNTYLGEYWGTEVHNSSAIQNLWFVLLAQGGSGTNDNMDTYNVNPIGLEKAEQIAYRNLTTYLTPSSNFFDAREYSIQSAIDLYGNCSEEVKQVINAWYAVGVGKQYGQTEFSADKTQFCSIADTVFFEQLAINFDVVEWDFGDGTTSSIDNPHHIYSTYGTYDVQLIGMNNCTNELDTLFKSEFITIDSTMGICFDIMPMENGQFFELNDCEGTISDDGGIDANHSNSFDGGVILKAQEGQLIKITFEFIDLELDYDYLEVYSGTEVVQEDKLIGKYTGSYNESFSVMPTDTVVLIRFRSDSGLNMAGFIFFWECITIENPPLANFEAAEVFTCNDPIQFNSISDVATEWLWDFGDGMTDSVSSPIHFYEGDGIYDVTLIVCNNLACDTLTKEDYITVDYLDISCDTLLMPDAENKNFISNKCHGFIVDAGGINNNYPEGNGGFSSSFSATTIILPDDNDVLKLTVHSLNIRDEVNFFADQLFYSTSPDYFPFDFDKRIDSTGTMYLNSDTVNLLFRTNADGLTDEGYVLEFECANQDTLFPIAGFSLSINFNQSLCGNIYRRLIETHLFADSVEYFIDGLSITLIDNQIINFSETGIYEFSQIVTNQLGKDTLTTIVKIIDAADTEIEIIAPSIVGVQEDVIFKASQENLLTLAEQNQLFSYFWYTDSENNENIKDEVEITKAYDNPGTYFIRLLTRVEIPYVFRDFSETCSSFSVHELTVESNTNTDDFIQKEALIEIFPNPVQTALSLNIKKEEWINQSALIEFVDIQGRTLRGFSHQLKDSQDFPLNDLNDGIYWMLIQLDGKIVAAQKFIVQK